MSALSHPRSQRARGMRAKRTRGTVFVMQSAERNREAERLGRLAEMLPASVSQASGRAAGNLGVALLRDAKRRPTGAGGATPRTRTTVRPARASRLVEFGNALAQPLGSNAKRRAAMSYDLNHVDALACALAGDR